MKLIVDTNKIIACLLKDGMVRRILFLPSLELYTVRYVFDEIEEYKNELLLKVSKASYELLLLKVKMKTKSIGFSLDDKSLLQIAKEIASKFDIDDYPLIALALKLNIPIWTNDKGIIKHSLETEKYLALDTGAVEDLISGKSLEELKENMKKRYLSRL
ncbi:MAG: PIN domain-containing protein [Thermoproteota archaeon]